MPGKQASKNMARLNEDIRRELVDIVGNMKDPRLQDGLITVTRVETAPDLSSCKVFVSQIGEKNSSDGMMKVLEAAKGHVRSEIASRMHIRRSPDIKFILDENAAYAAHINDLLKGL
ncbi:MAG: 30S ribosome-binding factor RbfA [Oscillospiraceae bacterium]